MSSEMDHSCEYHAEYRTVETKYDSTKTFVILTTQISVQVRETCGKESQKHPLMNLFRSDLITTMIL